MSGSYLFVNGQLHFAEEAAGSLEFLIQSQPNQLSSGCLRQLSLEPGSQEIAVPFLLMTLVFYSRGRSLLRYSSCAAPVIRSPGSTR